MTKPSDPQVEWAPCTDKEVAAALDRLAVGTSDALSGAGVVSARSAPLSFYPSLRLLEFELESPSAVETVAPHRYLLEGPDRMVWLDGTSFPIHEANDAESLELTESTMLEYLRFFLYFVRGDAGAFVLVESPDELAVVDEQPEAQERLDLARARISPLDPQGTDDAGRWLVAGVIIYEGDLFAAKFAIGRNGDVEMIEDEAIAEVAGISTPHYHSLALAFFAAPGDSQPAPYPWQDDSSATPPDRDVTEAIVAVLLSDAIREQDDDGGRESMLLRLFNAETDGDHPIDRLRRIVTSSQPVIIVESDLPFVEDFVAGLIDGPDQVVTNGYVSRAEVAPGEEQRCMVNLGNEAAKLHLLSFHTYSGLFDAERTAHELALRGAAVIVGCGRLADVPEPLRRIADLVLSFPGIDRRRFARIFERVFGASPPAGWDAEGTDWTRYLVPADFHTPRRLGLPPDDALRFLQERIEGRLSRVVPDVGPRLDQLHGLGEARQICEDLISDIRAAEAGRIPWSNVDKGVLLVGAPGTGKTTLARAVARECGIKFVAASAASWQSAGYLNAHLQAMRADFAEARRYAPAMLFLDEIDSIGSREDLAGDHNSSYRTDVINALLEQIQGIATVDPVIVIAATNYPERVDPALRRAGRLDQVVQLPLPNVAALEQIFGHYLEPHQTAGEVAGDLDLHSLAQLTLGMTGADVEFFVRGAARRGRRANRSIEQADLVAEVTRRPRRPDSAPQLGPEGMRRTGVHEAGHAVARLLSSSGGADVTFVTIVPRTDGTLGFVASVPLDGHQATRRTMIEDLEVFLAGRAAEELVYGPDDVGAGAGGPSPSSDLSVATRMAEMLVCQTGLGEDGALHWTDDPTPAQVAQIGMLLGNSYSSILTRLKDQRPLLDRVVEVLVDKQELSGDELRDLVDR